ncbi:glycosyltransferase [Delftia acidovorans]|uniref:glycosyltransferase n=1 Tax=Delftia acidovorans TaxID=80866 RepID=UPI0030EC606F
MMSTFNGMRFIRDQMDSILENLDEDDRVYVRDDGSQDDTKQWLRSIEDHRVVILESNANIGFGRSFMYLIDQVPLDFDMYFLADQDDVWLPTKVGNARELLMSAHGPCMVCTRLEIVDDDLNHLGYSSLYQEPPGFDNAVCQNIATGCSVALNQNAIHFLKKIDFQKYDSRLYYHDWWLYLNIGYFGEVIFDSRPSVKYRQHSGNHIGMQDGFYRYFKMITHLLRHPWFPILINQVDLFCEIHGESVSVDDIHRLEGFRRFDGLIALKSVLGDSRFYWQKPKDKWLFIMLLIFEMVSVRISKKRELPVL